MGDQWDQWMWKGHWGKCVVEQGRVRDGALRGRRVEGGVDGGVVLRVLRAAGEVDMAFANASLVGVRVGQPWLLAPMVFVGVRLKLQQQQQRGQ